MPPPGPNKISAGKKEEKNKTDYYVCIVRRETVDNNTRCHVAECEERETQEARPMKDIKGVIQR
jgi:hypothetical protein